MEPITIGKSDITTPPIGIGTMSWSNNKMFGYGDKLSHEAGKEVYNAAMDRGLTFFDTAEMYGLGHSERVLGRLVNQRPHGAYVATKYAPAPWRFTRRAFRRALDNSLKRLDVKTIDLYQVHFPGGFIKIPDLMDELADAADAGKIRYIGVSNYSVAQMREAMNALAKRGHPLVSNQVEYSLIHRSPEFDGVLDLCQQENITLIAYSPVGRGILNGKYTIDSLPNDMRSNYSQFKGDKLVKVMAVVDQLRVLADKYEKTPAQIAINWLARQPNVLPIPGAKHIGHVKSNVEAINFTLHDEDAALLDEVSQPFARATSFSFRPE